jgi:hypothetical protein
MVADLLVLDADPARDIRNARRLRLVVAAGWVYDQAARRALYARGKREARASR